MNSLLVCATAPAKNNYRHPMIGQRLGPSPAAGVDGAATRADSDDPSHGFRKNDHRNRSDIRSQDAGASAAAAVLDSEDSELVTVAEHTSSLRQTVFSKL